MSSKPYFKLYFSDLAGDTLGLSDAEMGSYVLLLGAMWNRGGSLPLDVKELARIARVSPAKWPKRWLRLKRFFILSRASFTHKRLSEERKKVAEISHINSENGKAGAAAKRLKSLATDEANASENSKRTRSHTRVHRYSPQPPEGALIDNLEWKGPADVRDAIIGVLGSPLAADTQLASCRWVDVPRTLSVTSPTAFAKLRDCAGPLKAIGVKLALENGLAA